MVQITVKISLDSTIEEAEKWLEELADNELFEFEIIKSESV